MYTTPKAVHKRRTTMEMGLRKRFNVRGMINLWQECLSVANRFRLWVCSELRSLDSNELLSLAGDYLFVIDNQPRFIVMVDRRGAWSISLSENSHTFPLNYEIDSNCLFDISQIQIQNIIDGSSRARILTDSNTLQKLLARTLKAHIAFITGKVSISGDLPAFLKMVSLLKKKNHGYVPLP